MKKPLFLLFMLASTQLPTLAQEADRDTTIVVPETGYLPIHPSRNFTTEQKGIIVCSLFGSNTSGLSFTKYALDSVVVGSSLNSSSGLILVARPGTYKLTLTDAEVTGRFNSTTISWQQEAGTAYKKGRYLYKFVNETERVGFQRDEKYAADNYEYCDLAEGEHIYLPLAEKNVTAAATLLETTLPELSFIPFQGPWRNVPTLDELPPAEDDSKKGDVNGDGSVDVADISAIISNMAGTATYDKADVNGDGSVDVADISAVISIMAGK